MPVSSVHGLYACCNTAFPYFCSLDNWIKFSYFSIWRISWNCFKRFPALGSHLFVCIAGRGIQNGLVLKDSNCHRQPHLHHWKLLAAKQGNKRSTSTNDSQHCTDSLKIVVTEGKKKQKLSKLSAVISGINLKQFSFHSLPCSLIPNHLISLLPYHWGRTQSLHDRGQG